VDGAVKVKQKKGVSERYRESNIPQLGENQESARGVREKEVWEKENLYRSALKKKSDALTEF